MKLGRAIYEVLHFLSISQADKTPLRDLFDKQDFNNVNEYNGSKRDAVIQDGIQVAIDNC